MMQDLKLLIGCLKKRNCTSSSYPFQTAQLSVPATPSIPHEKATDSSFRPSVSRSVLGERGVALSISRSRKGARGEEPSIVATGDGERGGGPSVSRSCPGAWSGGPPDWPPATEGGADNPSIARSSP